MSGLLKTLRQFAIAALGVLLVASVAAAQLTKAKPRPPLPKEREAKVTKVFLERFVAPTRNIKCPADFGYLGRIWTNATTEVKYTWVSSDGRTWPEQSLKINPATHYGGRNVEVSWKLGKPGETVKAWMQLKVLSPNEVVSNRSSIFVRCQK
jgi:hypothetical protein